MSLGTLGLRPGLVADVAYDSWQDKLSHPLPRYGISEAEWNA